MINAFLNPSYLSAFHLGLQAPDLGPVVPLSAGLSYPVGIGFLVPFADQFISSAGSLYREVQARSAGGSPRTVGPDPKDGRLDWFVSDAGLHEGGIETITLLQRGLERPLKEVRVRRHEGAVYVGVTYGGYGLQVTHEAAVGRGEKGDFQGLGLQLMHEALDALVPRLFAEEAALGSALSVYADDLCTAQERSSTRIVYRSTDEVAGPSRLNVSCVNVRGGPSFPDWLVAFMRKVEDEIRGQIRQHGGEREFVAPRELIGEFPR